MSPNSADRDRRLRELGERLAASRPELAAALDESVLAELTERLARLETLETEFSRALEQAKLEALKEFAYGAGHELNNPLANIATRAQTLVQEETDPERRKRLAAINSQAFRAHEMIADMMLFARPPHLAPARVNLSDLVEALLDKLSPLAEERRVTLRRTGDREPVFAHVDATQISVALKALVTNALEAVEERGGKVTLAVSSTQGMPQIVVADDGPGIPAEVRAHLFDPFYSGREAGRGLGLGLSKCWRIITTHGGTIAVESSPGHGSRFTITLPATPSR